VVDGTDIVVWVNDEAELRISVETWVLVGIEANRLAMGTQVKQDNAHPDHVLCTGVLTKCLATAAEAYVDRSDRLEAFDWSSTEEAEEWGRRRGERGEAAVESERDALLTPFEVDGIAEDAGAIIVEGVLAERDGVRDSGLPQGLLTYLAPLVPAYLEMIATWPLCRLDRAVLQKFGFYSVLFHSMCDHRWDVSIRERRRVGVTLVHLLSDEQMLNLVACWKTQRGSSGMS
jgi:hypothetical protein